MQERFLSMARRYEELIGEFDRERNIFGEGDSRTIIGLLDDGTVIKGRAVEGALETGLGYRFWGYWGEHPRYGRQFNFFSFTIAQPSGKRGTIAYLQRAPNIGRKRAERLWETHGPGAVEAIRERPEEVAAWLDGLTVEKAQQAAAFLQEHLLLEATTTELLDLGLNTRQIEWAIGQFGARAAAALRENMYLLMQAKGTGFAQADRLYLQCGGDPAAVHRVGWCSWNALHRDTDGHTWRPLGFCLDRVEKEIAGVEADYRAGIEWAVAERKIVLREVGKTTYAATFSRAMAEQSVAGEIHRAEVEMDEEGPPRYPTVQPAAGDKPGPSQHQVDGLTAVTAGLIGVLAGRPGTGKTFCLAELAKRMNARIAACAPTGKAAVRMAESFSKAGVKLKAKTIHSLLKMGPDGDPEYCRENPLSQEYDFIFCDESSMLDCGLMAYLLAARGDAAVLFCGDPGQLSPVGHGAPLRDLMAARVPCGLLTEIRRNAGRIVAACKDIAERHTFEPSPKIDVERGENFGWIEAAYADLQIERLKAILENLKGRGFDPIRDCQVIVAVNKKSPLSRKAINDLLQRHLNPNGEQVTGNPFRIGDKIVCTENGAVPAEGRNQPEADPEGRIRVFNGEQARVLAVFPRYTVAEMDLPHRKIRIPQGETGSGGRDDDSQDEDSQETGCKWQLAYGITLHKAQGSDWPVVIPLIDAFPGALRVCKREWIYTAASRAKQLCIGIGRLQVAREMCRTSGLADRKTFLVETIEELRLAGLGREWEKDLCERADVLSVASVSRSN